MAVFEIPCLTALCTRLPLLCLRYVLEFKLFWSFGYALGIKKFNTHYTPNPALEAHFKKHGARITVKALHQVRYSILAPVLCLALLETPRV